MTHTLLPDRTNFLNIASISKCDISLNLSPHARFNGILQCKIEQKLTKLSIC